MLGNISSDDAKIGGITPAVFTLSGRCERLAAVHLPADHALGVLDRDPALRALEEHDDRDDADADAGHEQQADRLDLPDLDLTRRCGTPRRASRDTMPAKMISEMPLPMPRSVICSPSHMMNAVPVVSVIIVIRRKPQPGSRHDVAELRAFAAVEALEEQRDAGALDELTARPCRSACTG